MLGFYWGYTGIMENKRILLFRGLGLWDLGWAAEDSGVQVTGAYPLSLGVWGCLASRSLWRNSCRITRRTHPGKRMIQEKTRLDYLVQAIWADVLGGVVCHGNVTLPHGRN